MNRVCEAGMALRREGQTMQEIYMGAWESLPEAFAYLLEALKREGLPTDHKFHLPKEGFDLNEWITGITRANCVNTERAPAMWLRYALWAVWTTRTNGGDAGEIPLMNPYSSRAFSFKAHAGLLIIDRPLVDTPAPSESASTPTLS